MSTLKTGALRGTSGTADTMTLHASDGSVEIPKLKVGSDAAGDVLYHNGTNYVRLAKGTDGQVLKLAGGVPTWGAAGGITVADEWRLTSAQTITEGDCHIGSGGGAWEQVDTAQQGTIGSAMTESNGTFTFPSTGIWQVAFTSTGHSSSAEQDFVYASLRIGGTEIAFQYSNCHSGGNVYYHVRTDSLCDIDDTSADTAKFYMTAQNGSFSAHGQTAKNNTFATFIRLGDT